MNLENELNKSNHQAIVTFMEEMETRASMRKGKAYEDIKEIHQKKNRDGIVGCKIITATSMADGQQVALKLKRITPEDPKRNIYNVTELYLNSAIIRDHPNIVKVRSVFTAPFGGGDSYFVMEMECASESLAQFIQRRKLSISETRSACVQLLRALLHIHRRNVVHGDIKVENVMIFPDMSVKLCDFGASRLLTRNPRSARYESYSSSDICPCGVEPPEIVAMQPFGVEVDMWCFGCMVLDMRHCKNMPFSSDPNQSRNSKMDIIKKVCLGEIPSYYFVDSKGCVNQAVACPTNTKNIGPFAMFNDIVGESREILPFVSKCFYANPLLRLTAASALTQPFIFEGYNAVQDIAYIKTTN